MGRLLVQHQISWWNLLQIQMLDMLLRFLTRSRNLLMAIPKFQCNVRITKKHNWYAIFYHRTSVYPLYLFSGSAHVRIASPILSAVSMYTSMMQFNFNLNCEEMMYQPWENTSKYAWHAMFHKDTHIVISRYLHVIKFPLWDTGAKLMTCCPCWHHSMMHLALLHPFGTVVKVIYKWLCN